MENRCQDKFSILSSIGLDAGGAGGGGAAAADSSGAEDAIDGPTQTSDQYRLLYIQHVWQP